MKLHRGKLSLRSINAQSDRTGSIQGSLVSSGPIKGFVCVWPRFPVLTPPMTTKAKVEKTLY